MHKPKKRNVQSPQKPDKKPVDWLEYLDKCFPPLVIPVGRRFQVDVADWTGPSNLEGDLGTSKWFGTRIWPLETEDSIKTKEVDKIGKGRPDSCGCSSPSSLQCINLHISEEQTRLQSELGPAYQTWKFDEMGDQVAKSWSSKQRKRFETLVRRNPLSEGKSFLKPAVSTFLSKSRKDIVSYYLNVYVPKRIGMLTRSGCKTLNSDDDEVEETPTNARNSLKRARSRCNDSTDLVKSHYLTGRR